MTTEAMHDGPGHGDVTLSITAETADGGHVIRSWVVCECSALLARLEPLLGEPAWQSVATREATEEIARRGLSVPGNVLYEGSRETGDGHD